MAPVRLKYQQAYPVTGKDFTNIGSVLASRNVPEEEQIALKMGIAMRSLWDRTGLDCLDTSMNIVAAQILLSVHRICCLSRPDDCTPKKRAGACVVHHPWPDYIGVDGPYRVGPQLGQRPLAFFADADRRICVATTFIEVSKQSKPVRSQSD